MSAGASTAHLEAILRAAGVAAYEPDVISALRAIEMAERESIGSTAKRLAHHMNLPVPDADTTRLAIEITGLQMPPSRESIMASSVAAANSRPLAWPLGNALRVPADADLTSVLLPGSAPAIATAAGPSAVAPAAGAGRGVHTAAVNTGMALQVNRSAISIPLSRQSAPSIPKKPAPVFADGAIT